MKNPNLRILAIYKKKLRFLIFRFQYHFIRKWNFFHELCEGTVYSIGNCSVSISYYETGDFLLLLLIIIRVCREPPATVILSEKLSLCQARRQMGPSLLSSLVAATSLILRLIWQPTALLLFIQLEMVFK